MNNLKKILIIVSISTLLAQNVAAPNNKINDMQKNMINQAKSLDKAGLKQEAILAYNDIFNLYPNLKEAFIPLKNYYLNQNKLDILDPIIDKYINANNNTLRAKIDAFDYYLISSKNWEKIIDEILYNKNFNSYNTKKVLSILLKNNSKKEALKIIDDIRNSKKNKQSFYCLEMGMDFSLNMDFENALNEYILYLKYNPKNIRIINQRIMVLAENESAISLINKKLENSNLYESKIILSNFLFKKGEYRNAYIELQKLDQNNMHLMSLAEDLISIEKFTLAEEIISDIINTSKDKNILNKGIFQLARLFEIQVKKQTNTFPLSKQLFNNYILKSPFISVNDQSQNLLIKATQIYDSLSTHNRKDYKSLYHLAEIKYKINGDLDGAQSIYKNVFKYYNSNNYKYQSLTNIINIYLSKNDLISAHSYIDSLRNANTINETRDILDLKEFQIAFYETNKDSLMNIGNNLLKRIPKDNMSYNDILDIMTLYSYYKVEEIDKFIDAEFKLFQNKRTQAINVLNSISPDNRIYDLSRLKTSHLEILQKNYMNALEEINKINLNDSRYNEEALLMKGEILDYGLNNIVEAIDSYLLFLELFPNSIYYDLIRIRLRELAI